MKSKNLLLGILAITLVFGMMAVGCGEDPADENNNNNNNNNNSGGTYLDFTYTETANAVTVTKYNGDGGSVVVPVQINGKPVTSIGQSAFYGKAGITGVTIPDGVITIGRTAFYGCTSLASIAVPNSVTNIGIGVFSQTAWFNSKPNGLIYIGKVAYQYKGTVNTSITILDGTKGIAGAAFASKDIPSVTIPNSVISIETEAFSNCSSLTSVTFQGAITSGGFNSNAFEYLGDLRAKYLAGGIGTYTRPNTTSTTWTKS